MAQQYIVLSRRFVELKPGQKQEAGWSMVFGGNYGLGWGYTSTFVVILAETGMGKTAELRARAAVLRAAGEEAYIGPDRPVLLFVCVRDVPGLLARSSNENRVRHCAGTGGGDDDRHETWKCSRE